MKIVRIGLCTVFAFSVLAFGTVEVWSQSLFEISAGMLFLLWALVAFRDSKVTIYWNPLIWPILGILAIGILQLFFGVTPYRYITRLELLRFGAYLIIFLLSVQAFRERPDLKKLAWFLIFLCFGISLIGIIQHFTSEGAIYWLRPLRAGGDPFGPYVNRNHFAGFVELTLPIGLAMLVFRGVQRDVYPLIGLLAIVPAGALILSGSRGGIVSFAFEIAVLWLLARSYQTSERPQFVGIGIVALAALALIAWLGAGRAIERFSSIHVGEVTVDRRVSMFRGAMHLFADHPITGVGLGALVAAYPRYETFYDGKLVDHVHNDYIELLAETGLLGGICGLVFLWILFRQAKVCYATEQGHFSRALHAGAVTGVCGMLVHSFVDFNLHIPSNVLLFLLLAHLATSPPLATEAALPRRRARSRERGMLASE
ncbi:MAG TPA: O-antigen ligase family protein [Candidatus Binatus sp.]|nr:O-antigen ligase family protein [Candidatus Binatus sp.]